MLDEAPVVAHAGEESLYVLVPLLVLFVAWRVWERLRNGVSADPDETPGRDDPGHDED